MNIRIILVGLLMGAAEVVPGVSGGTIAFVSGFYERLVNAIQRLTPMSLLELRKLGLVRWWREMDINFLLLLFGAMAVSVLVLARGVSFLLENYPVAIWAFFFGLVLSSVFVVARRLNPFTVELALAMGTGIALGLTVSHVQPFDAEVSPLTLFFGGCIAVCAWILPGLSGSFILLILGLYQTVIGAIKNLEILTLSYIALGCAVGLVSFSRLIAILLARFHNITVSVLVGFMLGSLVKIWPWKHTTSYQITADGGQIPLVQEPVLPTAYQYLTGNEPGILYAGLACLVGILVILILDKFALLAESDAEKVTLNRS
jgi:putative membrane protein